MWIVEAEKKGYEPSVYLSSLQVGSQDYYIPV